MKTDIENIIYRFAQKINSMEMGFSDLRQELEVYHFTKEEEDKIVKSIDLKIHELNQRKEEVKLEISQFWIGLVCVVIGTAITLGTWYGLIGDGSTVYFTYGLILYGIYAMIGGHKTAKKSKLFKSKFNKPDGS